MQLEKATADQLPRIVELKLAMVQEAGLAQLLAEDFFTRVLRDYHALSASHDAVHFVALQSGTVVAMAGGFLKSDLPATGSSATCIPRQLPGTRGWPPSCAGWSSTG